MTTVHPADTAVAAAIAPTVLSHSARQRIFLYLGFLVALLAFGSPHGGLIEIPISFFLKNRLHLTAQELADFRLVLPSRSICLSSSNYPRHLESLRHERPGIYAVVRRHHRRHYAYFAFIPVTL